MPPNAAVLGVWGTMHGCEPGHRNGICAPPHEFEQCDLPVLPAYDSEPSPANGSFSQLLSSGSRSLCSVLLHQTLCLTAVTRYPRAVPNLYGRAKCLFAPHYGLPTID